MEYQESMAATDNDGRRASEDETLWKIIAKGRPVPSPNQRDAAARAAYRFPTEEQRKVIVSDSPAILVIAGAGSGKTTTMTQRIAYHVARGNVEPGEVLGLTFTRKAAGNLANQVAQSLVYLPSLGAERGGFSGTLKQPTISTYNAFAAEIASTYGILVGVDPMTRLITDAERFQIMSEVVAETPANSLAENLGDMTPRSATESALALASAIIDNGLSFEADGVSKVRDFIAEESAAFEFAKEHEIRFKASLKRHRRASDNGWLQLKKSEETRRKQLALLEIVERYFQRKRELKVSEFADQVATAFQIVADFPEIAHELTSRYKLVLLDEYQDTSVTQANFLMTALTAHFEGFRSITAVGDPNQAIYGWRGASAAALKDFENLTREALDRYARASGGGERDVERLTLSTAFRNDLAVLAAGNAVAQPLDDMRFHTGPAPDYDPDYYRDAVLEERKSLAQVGLLTPDAVTAIPGQIAPLRNEEIPRLDKSFLPHSVDVVELKPRPAKKDKNGNVEAMTGRVTEVRPLMREDSYRAIAWKILETIKAVEKENLARKAAGKEERGPAEIVVLCRKRRYFDAVIRALRSADPTGKTIRYETVGGDSLVERPEIVTLRAALGVVADPRRVDLLVRLLVHWNIGVEDMRALGNWARQYAQFSISKWTDTEEKEKKLSARDESNLIEALAVLPSSRSEALRATFTAEGWSRLRQLEEVLDRLRKAVHAPLGDVMALAAKLLGIDLATATRTKGGQRVRTSLDQFISVARNYQNEHDGAGLSELVQWLDAVDAHEHGGEEEAGEDIAIASEDVEVVPGVVQIMTIHAAKGLEWKDLVVVPELVSGEFSAKETNARAWPQSAGIFPYPMRADSEHLPQFRIAGTGGNVALGNAYAFFKDALRYHESEEERRLAYVAFTRSGRELLLAGYAFRDEGDVAAAVRELEKQPEKIKQKIVEIEKQEAQVGKKALASSVKKLERLKDELPVLMQEAAEGVKVKAASTFLQLVRDAAAEGKLDLVTGDDLAHWPAELKVMAKEKYKIDELEKIFPEDILRPPALPPLPDFWGEDAGIQWPRDLVRGIPIEHYAPSAEDMANLQASVEELTTEEEAEKTFYQPYFTATDLVHLSSDPQGYAKDRLRPIPQEPSAAARLGTQLHARIAASYSAQATLDVDEPHLFSEVDDEFSTADEDELFAAFENSRWATCPPIAIEQAVEIVIDGQVIRCAIDAVVDSSGIPGEPPITIIDWKSGRRPTGKQLASRELQLAVYRYAWSVIHNEPLGNIGARFFYLREKPEKQELVAGMLEESEIVSILRKALKEAKFSSKPLSF